MLLTRWHCLSLGAVTECVGISGPSLTRGILIVDGSTGATVTGNTTAGGRRTLEVDDSSWPGSHDDGNSPA